MENSAVETTTSDTNKTVKSRMAGFKPSTDEELKSYAEKGAQSKETKVKTKTRPATLKEVKKAGQELKKGMKTAGSAKAVSKAAAPTNGTRRGRGPGFSPDARIKLLVDKNPKREGSKAFDQFKMYKEGMMVKDFLAKGGTSASLSWDNAHKLIEVR